jgi:hypothetical protein
MTTARVLEPAALAFASLVLASSARAQSAAPPTAAALREQAAAAIALGDYATACPKLDQALRLDPSALASRLDLAECYEAGGWLQSALGVYRQVETAADGAQKQKAHDRAAAIEPRLARMVVMVPDALKALPGLAITCDGVELGPGLWGVPLPVDKGTHTCAVTAGGARRVDTVIVGEGKTATLELRVPSVTAPPRRPAPEGVFVHLSSDDPTRAFALYRVDYETGSTTYAQRIRSTPDGDRSMGTEVTELRTAVEHSLCQAPCDQPVNAASGQEFLFGGEGLTPSSHFRIDPGARKVDIKVWQGSSARTTGGDVLLGIGGLVTVIGSGLFPVSLAEHSTGGAQAGTGILGAGAVIVAGGVVLLVTGKTRYAFVPPSMPLRF